MADEASNCHPDIEQALGRAGQWLLQNQDVRSGGWAERRGEPASSLNTAEVLLALGRLTTPVPELTRHVAEAVGFLEGQQTKDGANAGSWPRSLAGSPPCADLLRTSLAIEALAEVSELSMLPAVGPGVTWLLSAQNKDGGWFYRRDAPSAVLPACFALSALLSVKQTGDDSGDAAIRDGLAFLVRQQRSGGSFGEPGLFSGVRTVFAALCLQRAESCRLSVYRDERERAVAWLEDNPVAATKEVEETIEIDPDRDNPAVDYAFVFMTEALVVRLLSESPDRLKRESALAREALEALFKSMDAEGGFFGQRVFSWSTARAARALGSARSNFAEFPEAPRPPTPRQVGHAILAFSALTLIAVVLLSALGVFGVAQATVFMFLALVALVGYGRISETGFLEAIGSVLRAGGKGSA